MKNGLNVRHLDATRLRFFAQETKSRASINTGQLTSKLLPKRAFNSRSVFNVTVVQTIRNGAIVYN